MKADGNLTKKDLEEFGADNEDIAQVATILNTVPGTKFSLILSERNDGIIKGSLRSEKYKGVNSDSLFNAFIMPYNMGKNFFKLDKVVGNIGEAVGDWRNNNKPYERIQGIVEAEITQQDYYHKKEIE